MADSLLPPVVAVLTASISDFQAKMGEAKSEMASVEGTAGKMGALGKTALLGLAAGAVAVGVESVKMASSFQSTMELIATQAHAGQQEVDNMSKAVLDLAPTVGIGPEKLAEGLYHVESTGLRGQAALDVLRASAQEAALGMADFDSVTYAMSGVMSIAMGDVKDAADGVAYLNTIVGTGDMRMQDLANAIGTGVLPVFKVAGLGMRDFGAAITVMTDNAMPAEVAANHLKTAVQLLQNQSKPAADALASIGIKQGQLANDLRKPDGFLVAIEDVKTHLEQSGKTASEQGQILSKAFGGARSAATIEEFVSELDKLKGKYGEMGSVGERAAQQQQDWANTQATFAQKMKELGAQFQVWAIQIGQILLPILTKLAGWFLGSITWLEQHKIATQALVALLGVILAGAALSALGALGKLAVGVVVGPIKAFGSLIGAVGDAAVALDKGLGIAASYVVQWSTQLWGWLSTTGVSFARTAASATASAATTSATWIASTARIAATGAVQVARFVAQSVVQFSRAAASAVVQAAATSAAWLASMAVMVGRVVAQGAIWMAATIAQYVAASAAAIASAAATVTAWVAANIAMIAATGGIILLLAAVVAAAIWLGTHWSQVWNGIKEIASDVANAVKTAWNAAVDFLGSIPGKVGGFFKDAGRWLLDAGKAILNGLLDGLKAAWNSVTDFVGGIGSWIADHKGPIEYDRTLLTPHGNAIMSGLLAGLQQGGRQVQAYLGAFTTGIGSTAINAAVNVSGSAVSPLTAGAGAASGQSVQVNITMNPRDVQTFLQQGTLRYNLRNTGNGLSVGVA